MEKNSNNLSESVAAIILMLALVPVPAFAQEPPKPRSPPPASRSTAPPVGIELFGGAALTWPAASDTFDAAGLDSRSVEFGGGARVTNLWRSLFVQVAVSRWSESGERAFVDSTGERFPLGIPLDVGATYVDVATGWKTDVIRSDGKVTASPYVGAGAGVAMYSEESPFGEPGDDLEKNGVSFHVLGGVEIPLLRWLAVAVDGRYRYVPNLFGDGGLSGAFDEDVLGGLQAAVGLRVGVTGQPRRTPPAKPVPVEPPAQTPRVQPPPVAAGTGVILESAPVYLLPDSRRVPLRTLAPGTQVRVLEEGPEWIRIEFPDAQFGPRIGYVQRKFVQIRTPD